VPHKHKDCCCCEGGPLIYEAILLQDGTATPPVDIVLRNDFSGDFVWEYGAVGDYTGNLPGQFPDQNKVLFSLTLGQGGISFSAIALWLDSDRIETVFFDDTTSPVDFSGRAYLVIKVYP
jgi:hypothetical protein